MKKLIALAMSLTAIAPLTAAAPAQAATVGALAFTCEAILPSFPSPGDSGTCAGMSAATGAGLSTDLGYVVTGVGTFNAEFSYNEGCVASGLPPASGTASGSATVEGLTAVGPGGTKAASADLIFSWTRTALVAVVTVNGTLTVDDVGSTSVNGRAVAAFAPVLTLDNVCPEGGPVRARVAGAAELGV
ncbi:MAG: hypothetical protein M3134_07210 [Actinomycetota bacterium]|nr:hypothetical protein [Actinomycetota bacterium]